MGWPVADSQDLVGVCDDCDDVIVNPLFAKNE